MYMCLNIMYNYVSVYICLVYYSYYCIFVCLGCNGVFVLIKDKLMIFW